MTDQARMDVKADDFYDDDAASDDRSDCDCEDYDFDWGIGRATCNRCDRTWYLSDSEIEQHYRWAAEYAQHYQQTPWQRLTDWFTAKVLSRLRGPKVHVASTPHDDDLPF